MHEPASGAETGSAGTRARRRWILAGLLAAAALVELGLLASVRDVRPRADELQYLYYGSHIAQGRELKSAIRPPVYPYAVALTLQVAGESDRRVSMGVLQIATNVLSALLLYALAAECFGPRAALLAAGGFAFYPTFVAHTHLLWSDLFALCPTLGALWLLVRARRGGLATAALAGAVLGVGALTREFLFWFSPVAVLWLVLAYDDPRAAGRPRPARRILAGALVAAGLLAVVLPWSARNYRVHGAPILIAANTWSPLFLENNEHPEWKHPWRQVHFYAEYRGRDLERERFAREEALRFIGERMPGWVLERVGEGLPRLLSVLSFPLRHLRAGLYGEVPRAVRVATTLVTVAAYLALLVGSSFGLAATRWNADRLLLLLFMLYAAALVLPFPVVTRYRLPLEALALPFAAAWVAQAPAVAGRLASRARLAAAVGLAAVLIGLAWWDGAEPTADLLGAEDPWSKKLAEESILPR